VVHPDWKQAFTQTGRFSCGEPNMQNLPREPEYRSKIIAPPGHVILSGDLSQIEARLVALIAPDHALINLLNEGGDVYTRIAQEMYKDDTITKQDGRRQVAKSAVLGLMFGMGESRFLDYMKTDGNLPLTTIEETRVVRNLFFRLFPEIKAWHARTGDRLNHGSITITSMGGRLRRNMNNYGESLNMPVQGTAADGIKMALSLLYPIALQHDSRIIAQVHDEILLEVPENLAETMRHEVGTALITGIRTIVGESHLWVPFSAEVGWGSNWNEAKHDNQKTFTTVRE
jgi:DNA polymerase I-like protein with 3'-5' exonuclease and polymerase domains